MTAELREVDRLASEMLEVLWSYYLLSTNTLGSEDPVEAMRSLKIMALLSDDLLLRLAKLGETRRDTWNFAQVVKQFPNLTQRSALQRRVAEYQHLIVGIAGHRNRRIAHTSKASPATLEPTAEMLQAIHLAVDLVDEITGIRNTYEVAGLDLRLAALGSDAA
jgi:hypothetical protein